MPAAHLPHPPRSAGPGTAPDALRRRSAGLHRIHGITRWTLVGSAASALVLGLGYAHALPDPAALLPTLPSHSGQGGDGTNGSGVQAPTLPVLGSQGSHTTTGGS